MRSLFLLVTGLSASGCFTTGYLLQAAGGQYELIHVARPLSVVKDDPTVPLRVRELLAKVPAIKRYGQLNGLTPTGNYSRYSDLRRPAAVWVVQGCQELAFEPRRWKFPIVGTVPYLGFFSEQAARDFAKDLAREEPSLDVTVRTASAYSTLGWFKDPVLSTMIPEGPEAFAELANVILHESVHATVYVKNQSAFDESLASFVADELTWLLVVGRFGLQSKEARALIAGEERGERFVKELHVAYEELEAIYKSTRPDDEKRALKNARLDRLQQELGMKRRLNNADLAGFKTYDTGGPAFAKLRKACGGLPKFLEAVKSLTEEDFPEPQLQDFGPVLEALAQRKCQGL